jgi:hypothetical protein
VFRASLFGYLPQNVDAADAFNQGMANVSSMLAYAVLMAYDFAGISSIVDIRGGQGKLLEKILQFTPDITGTVFDTASTVAKGRALIVDMVVPDTDAMSFSKLLDLNMLAMTGGRERTKAEFRALLDAADYELTGMIPTLAPQSIIEAAQKSCSSSESVAHMT